MKIFFFASVVRFECKIPPKHSNPMQPMILLIGAISQQVVRKKL